MQLNPPVLMPVWMTVIAIIGVILARSEGAHV